MNVEEFGKRVWKHMTCFGLDCGILVRFGRAMGWTIVDKGREMMPARIVRRGAESIALRRRRGVLIGKAADRW